MAKPAFSSGTFTVETGPVQGQPGKGHAGSGPSWSNAIHATENANIKAEDASLSRLFLTVDGIPVPDLASHIVDSSFFDPGDARAGTLAVNYFQVNTFPGTPLGPAKSGEAWVMIGNLAPGPHTLTFGGHTSLFHGVDLKVSDQIVVGQAST